MTQMQETASRIEGQFTGTIHTDDADPKAAQCLLQLIERETSRILANGFPTRVEATDALVHAGPYPASTNFGATAVGTLSIRRFPRAACCQDLDTAPLPEAFDTEKAKKPLPGTHFCGFTYNYCFVYKTYKCRRMGEACLNPSRDLARYRLKNQERLRFV